MASDAYSGLAAAKPVCDTFQAYIPSQLQRVIHESTTPIQQEPKAFFLLIEQTFWQPEVMPYLPAINRFT